MQWILAIFCWWCTPPTTPPEENIGNSPGYKLAAKTLKKSINFSVDPCQDFYEFTCGKWAKKPIPGHHMFYSRFAKLEGKVQNELREMFESQEKSKSKVINGLKTFYKKCMDINEQNRIGAKRMIRILKKFGVWPILQGDDKWNEEEFDLTSLLSFVSRLRRVDLFVNFKLTRDEKNVSRRLLEFTQGGLTLPIRIYTNKNVYGDKINVYRDFLVEKVMLYQKDGKISGNKTKIEEDVDEVVGFETEIAEIRASLGPSKNLEQHYNIRRFRKLRKYTPLIDWDRFFHEVAPATAHPYFESNPQILVRNFDYLKRINNLLKRTDPRIITNYVFLRFSSILTKEMGERYEDVNQDYMRAMYGRQEKAPRWIECTKTTTNLLKYASSAMYIKRAFDKESKKVTLDMIDDLQAAFRVMLKTNNWLDGPTKKKALYKAKKMLQLVGYPDFILDDKKLDKHYKGVYLNDDDSYGELLEKVAGYTIEHIFKRLMEPVDRSEYDFNSAAVNAYYDQTVNSIKLPAAILQAPFFHHTFPRALNYGGIGSIIGHEITHGFDNEGRQFDASGNLHDWWDMDVQKKFEKRAQCFVDQYSKIEVPGTNHSVNGELTQAENIADNGGVKQAYRAYKAYLQRHGGNEPRIKGLEKYDNDQMFFIGYASVWCERTTPQRLVNQILTDAHSPARYRVNQVLANQPEFANAFQCKKGTPMNPKKSKRCAVW